MSDHSEIWEFGPDKEFADFNSAITALNDHFAGGPFTSDQFLLGTPYDDPYRDTEQLNDKIYPFVFNGYRLVISSADSSKRVKFSGKRIVPGNTFLKLIEDQEPSGPVWKSNWLQTQSVTSYNELYEDGILLSEKLSIGEVEETPGSYFVDVDRMMYVHARDSSRVRISGQYEFTINSNIFKWVCFDLNDQPKNINILDVDFDHSLEAVIRLERNLFNLTSFDGFTVLNCRFKTNHRFIEANGAINGLSIRGSSFIEDSNFTAVDSGILLDSVGNITITHNYLKTYDDSWIILVNSISGITNVNENVIINGSVSLSGDESNFKRNLFVRSNNAGNNGMALKATSLVNNIIGNAFVGFNNNTWYVDTAYNTGIYNFQNNTVWTELGANQVLFTNVRDDATINSKLNLISIKGIIYDGPSLGLKTGNVYLMDSAPVETKSRSASYRNVFSRTYSYNASIDAIDIIPVDDICKSVLRRTILDEELDITGAVIPCHIDSGCIQTNHGSNRLESFRWLPDWITEVSLPDDLVFHNYNAYASKNRRFNTGCEGTLVITDPPTIELFQINPFNRMFIGSNGGLMSYDGSTFSRISELPIAPTVVYTDPNTGDIYAASGYKIFLSSDNGLTWSTFERTVISSSFEQGVIKVFGKFGSYYYGLSIQGPENNIWTGRAASLGYSTDLINWISVRDFSYVGANILKDGIIYVSIYGNWCTFSTIGDNTTTQLISSVPSLGISSSPYGMAAGETDFWVSVPGSNLGGNKLYRSIGFNNSWVEETPGFTLPAMMEYSVFNPGEGKVFCASNVDNPYYYFRSETTRLSFIDSSLGVDGNTWNLCTLPASVQTLTSNGIVPFWDAAHSKYIGLITNSNIVIQSTDGITWTDAGYMTDNFFMFYGAVPGAR